LVRNAPLQKEIPVKAVSCVVAASALLLTTAIASAQEPTPAPEGTPPGEVPTEAAPVEAAPVPPAEPAPAEPAPAATEAPLFQINGFLSGSYIYNLNSPAMRGNGLAVFHGNDQTFRVDVAELVFQHPVSDPGSVGFRIDLAAGSAIPKVSASAGLLAGTDIDLQQAYISYLFKGVDGLRLDAGKFITHMGWEVIEGYDGYNDNYTRSILFGYTIPFTHTGLKVSKTFSSMVSGTLLLVNGWDVALDNNDTPSLGLQVVLTPNDKFQIYLNAIGGREQVAPGDALRMDFNLIGIAKLTPTFTLVLDTVFGSEGDLDKAGGGNGTASWYGAAVYAKNQFTPEFALTLRGEFVGDPDHVRLALPALALFEDLSVYEVTLTPSYAVAPNFVVRADLRLDGASEDIFETDDGASGNQFLVALNALATF
jgi:hypothetical protein